MFENQQKYELRNIISGNERVGQKSLITTIKNYLSTSQKTSGNTETTELTKKSEEKQLILFIDQNNLWVNTHLFSEYLTEGAEQKVYLCEDENCVIKKNSLLFYLSWQDYFNSLLLHNYFFENTFYTFLGFTKEDDNLFSVVKQPFILANQPTNLENVKKFLFANGFENQRFNDYQNRNLGIILEDLHEENVLTCDNVLFFVDSIFYLKDAFYEI